jgi:diguanylate cyclase (GGDEF)-like protein
VANLSLDRRRLAALMRRSMESAVLLDRTGGPVAAQGAWAASLLETPAGRRRLGQAARQAATCPDAPDPAGFLLTALEDGDHRPPLGWLATPASTGPAPAGMPNLDARTGLMTRPAAERALGGLLEAAALRGEEVAVLYIDLVDLRAINEIWGRPAGDTVLEVAASRLRGLAGQPERLARVGGDKFLMLLHPIRGAQQVAWLAETVAARLEEPVLSGEQVLACRVRIGGAVSAGSKPRQGEELIAHARMALDGVGSDGRRRFHPYLPGTAERRRRQQELGQALKHAIGQRQLSLEFQPQRSFRPGARPKVEALLRWHHPGMGWIPPSEFIPVAEKNGLILPIGRLVLVEACRQAVRWAAGPLGAIDVAVNVSPAQFSYPEIYDEICLVLEETGLDPQQLTLEVTEGLLVQDVQATARTIGRLKSVGLKIAIDDFGAGHSSLAYLAGFAADELKMDRCFLGSGPAGAQATQIITAIVALAHRLGMQVVAEGVETAAQLQALEKIGCDRIQGFYHARPMPAAAVEEFLLAQARACRKRKDPVHRPAAIRQADVAG